LRHRERQWQNGHLGDEDFLASVNSYWALLSWYPFMGLRRRLNQPSIVPKTNLHS
jgi:hypothetical protein